MAPLTLSFRDPVTEGRFQQAYFEDHLTIGRICHLVAVFFYITVGAWDTLMVDPSRLPVWTWVASTVTLTFLAGLTASYGLKSLYAKYWRPLFAVYVLVTGWGFTLFTAVSAPDYPVYNFMGIIFCLFFCYTFIRLTFAWATAAGNAIVIAYIATAMASAGPNTRELFSSFFYIAGIDLLGMAVCYSQELASRKGFVLNEMLRQNRQAISDLNAGLEQRVRERTAQLEKSLAALEQAESIAALGYFEHHWRTGKAFWSKGFFRLLGKEEERRMLPMDAFLTLVHPDDVERLKGHINTALDTGERMDIEFRLTPPGEKTREIHAIADSVYDGGSPLLTRGVLLDTTDWNEARAALAKIEDQLLQARKMESIGRLAGGVAHDYNNMLSLIIGHAELAMDGLAEDHPHYEHLEQILSAAGRSATITRQLLAFARKEAISPRPLDLNRAVEGTLTLLRRLIGENVTLDWVPACDLSPVNMDPFQIDQLLINLCTNARDAINGSGSVTIATENRTLGRDFFQKDADFKPGAYVMLSVTDTGRGMEREVLDKVFEPFFTTKDLGKGTGLGMSTVYGVVKQNHGFIDIESEPRQGSTVRIYLPRSRMPVAAPAPQADAGPLTGNGEIILLVEDNPDILTLGNRILTELNYTVLPAATPADAVQKIQEFPDRIDLLVTDVVMPETTGKEMARRVQRHFPDIGILYMSGYTEDIISDYGVLDKDAPFLAKPFTKTEMAIKVKEALKGQRLRYKQAEAHK